MPGIPLEDRPFTRGRDFPGQPPAMQQQIDAWAQRWGIDGDLEAVELGADIYWRAERDLDGALAVDESRGPVLEQRPLPEGAQDDAPPPLWKGQPRGRGQR